MNLFATKPILAACLSAITITGGMHITPRITADDERIRVNLLQLNDVYEISSLQHGMFGGMARVASLRKELVKENPNTYTIMAGDFLFPSAIGTLEYKGNTIKGQQMVELMNAVPVDLVTFGNHEFDLNEVALANRINESTFDWVSANIWHKTANGNIPFVKMKNNMADTIPATKVISFTDADGTVLKIGVFGVTLSTPDIKYMVYEDYLSGARRALTQLKGSCDIIVAVTHLELKEDRILAQTFPEINFIIGGHEHQNSYTKVGKTFIAKADANARTAYVHAVEFNAASKEFNVVSKLVVVNEAIQDDAEAAALVNKWNRRADSALLNKGIIPCEPVALLPEPYDGREASVRTKKTNLTHSIATAMSMAAKSFKPDFSMYNGGSIRIDDVLEGNITQYDLFRVLPYGGIVLIAQMRGSLLDTLFSISDTSQGNGCFLQHDRITRDKDSSVLVNGVKLNPRKIYKVAVNDFLVSGGEKRMKFLNKDYPGLKIDTPRINDKPIDLLKSIAGYFNMQFKPPVGAKVGSGVPCD